MFKQRETEEFLERDRERDWERVRQELDMSREEWEYWQNANDIIEHDED